MSTSNDNKIQNENVVVKYSVKYILYAAGILGVINLLDIFSSNATPLIQSFIVQEFFVDKGIDAAIGYARMNLLTLLAFPLAIIALSLKFIVDKYGRKPGLIISIIGMTIGAILVAFSQNFLMYMIGNLMGSLFLAADIQLMMVQEESPIDKRARYLAFARIIGLLGALLVPLSREIFLSGSEPNWRAIYYFPFILGIVLTLVVILTIKESSVYLTMKKQKEIQVSEENKEEKPGFFKSLKIASKTPHFKVIVLTSLAAILGTLGGVSDRSYMEPLLSDTFTLTQVNIIYYVRFGISIILGLVMGVIRDKMGRKIGLIITLCIQCVFFILFLVFISQKLVILTGLAYGLYIYALWMHTVTSGLIKNELTPTEIRGTMSIIVGLLSFGIMGVWQVISSLLVLIPWMSFDIILLIATIPFSIAGIIIVIKVTPETKGTDLTKINALKKNEQEFTRMGRK